MFAASISLVIFGIMLYLAGRRGWLMGSHPYCRACGFDLFRLPVERRRCPECGADILVDGAIEVGRRRPMRGVMGAGMALVLAGIAIGAVAFVPWWSRFDGSAYKPVSWLQADVGASDDILRQRATAELLRRIRAGRVSPVEAIRLADALLAKQGDPAIAWRRSWGDLIQAAHTAGKISPERWERYLRQAMQVTASVRARVGVDEPVPVAISCRLRAGSDWQALAPATLQPQVEISLGKIRAPLRISAAQILAVPAPLEWSTLWMPADSPPVEALNPGGGPQVLEARVTMVLRDRGGVTASVTQNLSLPLEILAAKQSSVEMRVDPAIRAEVNQSVVVRVPGGSMDHVAVMKGGASRIASVWISGPPATLAYRIMLRQGGTGGKEWLLARLMVRPNDAANVPLVLSVSALGEPPVSGPAEIVFVPDATMAEGTVDVLEIWGESLTRKLTLEVVEH